MAEKKQRENVKDRRNTRRNEVMITVYVESPITRTQKTTKPYYPQLKKPRASESKGYDRRAQLLAYSRRLRNKGLESQYEVQFPTRQQSRHQQIKENCSWFKLCAPATGTMLRRSNSQMRFERMPLNQSTELKPTRTKKKSNGKPTSSIMRKLKGMLKEMSCKKLVGCNEDEGGRAKKEKR